MKPGSGVGCRVLLVRHGVADARVGDLLDGGGEEADLAGPSSASISCFGPEDADALDLMRGARRHQLDFLALLQRAVDDADQHDHAEIGVVPAVDQQRLEGHIAVALGCRQALDDGFQHGGDVLARLGGDGNGVRRIDADHVLDLLLDAVGIGGRQVDLVEDGQDFEVVVDGLVDVGQRLRLHALAGVHHQHSALAGGERARHLVGEVDVARRIHQVELIGLAVLVLVVEAHGLRLDGDAALALDVHRVEDLLLHVPVGDVAAQLDHAGPTRSTCRGRCGR